jgi:hypothetical protein
MARIGRAEQRYRCMDADCIPDAGARTDKVRALFLYDWLWRIGEGARCSDAVHALGLPPP